MEIEKNNGASVTTYTIINALMHTVVYAILFWYLPGITEGWRYLHYYALFGLCAYGTQPLIGLLSDFCARPHFLAQTGVMLVGIGYFCPTHFSSEYVTAETALTVRMILLGLGLAFFRASAGGSILRRDEGKALPIGVFLSSSSFGIALAVFLPKLGYMVLPVLFFAAAAPDPCAKWAMTLPEKKRKVHPALAAVLTALLIGALFLRSFTETRAEALFPSDKKTVVLLALAVLAGRIASGLCRDLIGLLPTLLTLPAGIWLLFFTDSGMMRLGGLFLLNMTLPLMYFAAARLAPRFEGLAFGLCSALLFPAAWVAQRGGLVWEIGDEKRMMLLILIGAALTVVSLAAYAILAKDFRFIGRAKKEGGKTE